MAKFPALGETFTRLSIDSVDDIARLSKTRFSLPALSEVSQIPTNVIFTQESNKLIDFNSALKITNKGDVEQIITTISNSSLSLTIRPDAPVKSIHGYLVLKKSRFSSTSRGTGITSIPMDSQLASVISANIDFGQKATQPAEPYTDSFSFTDPDGDGLYTANIKAPGVASTYQVVTVIDYKTNEKKELRLTLVVDPEGYVYVKQGENETRIKGATVTIYVLDEKENFIPWPANEFQQINPQITDVTGEYSFLVPPGEYRLEVKHPDYDTYIGTPFIVQASEGVHMNVEMHAGSLAGIPWYWWGLAGFVLLLTILIVVNFLRDRQSRSRI